MCYFFRNDLWPFFILLPYEKRHAWPQSREESQKCDAGDSRRTRGISEIRRINCLWSLMLDVRAKFVHQIEVLSLCDIWIEIAIAKRVSSEFLNGIFPTKSLHDFCKIFWMYPFCAKKNSISWFDRVELQKCFRP